jgi:hypothetical protein
VPPNMRDWCTGDNVLILATTTGLSCTVLFCTRNAAFLLLLLLLLSSSRSLYTLSFLGMDKD